MLDTDGKVIELDEFAHLPQKIEDLKELKGYYINNNNELKPAPIMGYLNQESARNTFPFKYAQAIRVQPKLLQLYEAWKDEGPKRNCVRAEGQAIIIGTIRCTPFVFNNEKKAERFLELFKTELEQYKPLMGGQ